MNVGERVSEREKVQLVDDSEGRDELRDLVETAGEGKRTRTKIKRTMRRRGMFLLLLQSWCW